MTTISTNEREKASGRPPPAVLHAEPDRNCPLCPRLAGFREAARAREPDWFNSPVPSFGDPGARLLIVGLAPGLQGANRTGRPFTGDHAGTLVGQPERDPAAIAFFVLAVDQAPGHQSVDDGGDR